MTIENFIAKYGTRTAGILIRGALATVTDKALRELLEELDNDLNALLVYEAKKPEA